MKSFKVAALFMSLLLSLPAVAQFRGGGIYEDLYDSENVAAMKEHVRMLSSAMMEGRAAGSEGEEMAAEYVAEQFRECGLDMLSPSEGDVFGLRTDSGDTLTARNVV